MTTVKHTEGPWEIGLDRRGVERVFAGRHEIVRALSEHGNRRLSKAERAANRRLIAAAPAMLEALRSLLACPAIADEDHNDPVWGDPEMAEAVNVARAALSAAQSETEE